jgi:hypothetical protein
MCEDDEEVEEILLDFIPNATQDRQLQSLLKKMSDFDSVMKKLQDNSVNIAKTRVLFDKIIEVFINLFNDYEYYIN